MFSASCLSVPEDLSLEERDELSNIRRRKRELLDDIEVCMTHTLHCTGGKPVMHCVFVFLFKAGDIFSRSLCDILKQVQYTFIICDLCFCLSSAIALCVSLHDAN